MGPLQDIRTSISCDRSRAPRGPRASLSRCFENSTRQSRAQTATSASQARSIEIPTDVLRTSVPPALVLEEWLQAKAPRVLQPDPVAVAEAVDVFWSAKRPLVISGRGARQAGAELVRFNRGGDGAHREGHSAAGDADV